MRTPQKIAITSLLLIVVCALASHAFLPQKPAYNGKDLNAWLADFHKGDPQAAGEAVRHIGTNSVPTLLRLLQKKDSSLKVKSVKMARKQQIIVIRFVPARMHMQDALSAFRSLGPQASNAVPALVVLLDQNHTPETRAAAAEALGLIGPAAQPAIPSLLRETNNPNSQIRANALWALASIHAGPDCTVRLLTSALSDCDPGVRIVAAESLGYFQADAKPAVPALTKLLNDKNAVLREVAIRSLKQIDPEAHSNSESNIAVHQVS
ncbi:MAG: repeat protein [Pedosphaera sp.]|nr:repeat protein [Pedosphaera sp.]